MFKDQWTIGDGVEKARLGDIYGKVFCLLSYLFLFYITWASLVAQMVKNLPAMQENQVWSLSREDPLLKEMATHFSILAWRIPWTEEPSGLQSMRYPRVDPTKWLTLSFSLSSKHTPTMAFIPLCVYCHFATCLLYQLKGSWALSGFVVGRWSSCH